MQKVFVALPVAGDQASNPFGLKRAMLENGLVGKLPFACEPYLSTNLCYGFDQLLVMALNGGFDYFVMVHADIVPEAGFAWKLIELQRDFDADMVSVMSPIKSGEGVYSCGIGKPDSRWGPLFRITAKQLAELPDTFCAGDLGYPDHPLLLNTGCWVADLHRPWVRQTRVDSEDGRKCLAHSFYMNHRIAVDDNGQFQVQTASEDWNFSRDLWLAGCRKLYATKAVKLRHCGGGRWKSEAVWGAEFDPASIGNFIGPTGAWQRDFEEGATFDQEFADDLIILMGDGATVLDMGCGRGEYVRYMHDNGHCSVAGVDGNPKTKDLDFCFCHDLTERLSSRFVSDWVLCLEVGEHVPERHQDMLLNNVSTMARKGVVISWAQPGQPGVGHVNCREPEWVVAQMAARGWKEAPDLSARLRKAATLPWFQRNTLVFVKKNDRSVS